MKIRPMGSELYYADRVIDGGRERKTDIKKLIVVLRNFSN